MLLVTTSIFLATALQPPSTAFTPSRRAVLTAAPLALSSVRAAHAGPLDILFGWIPPVEEAPSAQQPDRELTAAEKIRKRRRELEEEEAAKQMAEYMKNRGNSAASRATDAAGAAAAGAR